MNTRYDAIIVGGGHNGLVAASYLAKAGKRVLLLEAQDALGGATTSVKPFYTAARSGEMPQPLPLELYCHTLTDPTILSPELVKNGFQTLTLFGLHTPAKLFDGDPEGAKALAKQRAIASLNEYLLDPIESVLAPCRDGSLAIEVKSPLDLEKDISLPRGNIFHRDLDFPFLDGDAGVGDKPLWGAETDDPHIYLAGAGAIRGGGVSGIAGHNAAMALLAKG